MVKNLILFLILSLGLLTFSGQSIASEKEEGRSLHTEETAISASHESDADELGTELPVWTTIPFAGILLSIAVFPLIAPHFWHHHFPKISAFWALLFAIPFLISFGNTAIHEILHIYLIDYIPFIILLWGLFAISGGILVKGTLKGKPVLNTVILLIGTLIASWIGTTGASMLLIRPLIRANKERKHKVHIVIFFIFLVSNIGGSLTPLGDPPLFLGFLHGVPFFWTFNLILPVVFVSLILLVLFFGIDSYYIKKEDVIKPKERGEENIPIRIEGLFNMIFLGGIVAAVLMSGFLSLGNINISGIHLGIQNILRDIIIIIMGLLSLYFTSNEIRKENGFTWFPILEVAYLFAGIFMTIIPALAILKAGEDGAFKFLLVSIKEPYHYFWVTGILSSFLDNAPTYLTFLNTALGNFFSGVSEHSAIQSLIAEKPLYLLAISTGAVFMGANTYIGNAPNFMVKSIAEENGINMPSFFGYILKYSLPILIPTFILVSYFFFS
ncbi:MAG: sodium:proton antiporter [Nitrospirota bacterium]